MTKQIIRRFQVTGQFLGGKIVQSRETQRKNILNMMRDEGFVPLLDLDPVWEQSWVKDDTYEFTYTWQGVYIGEDKAWQTEGVSGGKTIVSSPRTK